MNTEPPPPYKETKGAELLGVMGRFGGVRNVSKIELILIFNLLKKQYRIFRKNIMIIYLKNSL